MKFAGDAMIVLWGEAGEDEPLASLVRRAAQCGTQCSAQHARASKARGPRAVAHIVLRFRMMY